MIPNSQTLYQRYFCAILSCLLILDKTKCQLIVFEPNKMSENDAYPYGYTH